MRRRRVALAVGGLLLAAIPAAGSSRLSQAFGQMVPRERSATHAPPQPRVETAPGGALSATSAGTAASVSGTEAASTAEGDPRQGDAISTPRPAADTAPSYAPITRLRVARIGLDADVVEAPLVEVHGGTTWEVPAFKVGHGENSAAAAEPGNAVLLGHVTSTNAGNVFRDLRLLRSGDLVEVFGGPDVFGYVVTQVRSVPRTDLSPLQPTDSPTVTLLTCSGVWLPAIADFTERLIVRAELMPPLRAA